jgi:dihydroorotate dehydrogenase electron transfer subunit
VSTPATGAELVASREILPGEYIHVLHAPYLAVGSRAGQYMHVRTGDDSGLVMLHPLPINTADRASGTITVHVRAGSRWGDWLTEQPPGSRLDVRGPLGRPFEVDPRSRHVLLVAGGSGMSGVRLLADESIGLGRQVTVLFGAVSARTVYPSSLLPDEVEYVVATDDGSIGHHGPISDLVPAYEAWADQAFASGPPAMLAALARLAATRRGRMGVAKLGRKRGGGRVDPVGSPAARRKAFLQVCVEQSMGCAVATCLGCVVFGAAGSPQRVCREGPVFAAEELDWEAAS